MKNIGNLIEKNNKQKDINRKALIRDPLSENYNQWKNCA